MISVFGSLVEQDEIDAVAAVMASQWMGFGKHVAEFEESYKEKFGLQSFAMVDSGSNALFMAITLLDLPPASEIILPSFTWVACAQAIIMAGHVPVFADVDLETMNIRVEDVESKLTDKTGAVMVVHYAGLPVDIEPIIRLGYPVIEDAAHAVYSTRRGVPLGTLGAVGIFSFDAVKNLTVGEGGGITARDPLLIDRAKTLRYCGIGKSGFDSAVSKASEKNRWWEYNIQYPFIKMLPTNLSASIGLVQLGKIDRLQQRREFIWNCYQEEFGKISDIVCPRNADSGDRHSHFTYCIRTSRRDELANYLLNNGIYTTLRYHPLHLSGLYKQENVILENCDILNREALSIPIHPRLSDQDLDLIVGHIKKFFG